MTSATVAIHYANGRVERRTLVDGVYLVGRDAGDIVLGDPDVSASHARLEVRQGQVLVTDLGSTNGTIGHDQQRVRPGQALGFGQTIRMGRSGITVVTGAEAGGTRAMVQVPNMTALPAPRAVPAPSAPDTGAPPSELQVRGNRILCRAGRATKVSLSGYAATHVSGGGSTTTHGPGGYIHTNNSVSSYTTHHTVQELWLRTDESEDLRFQLRDSNVDVLDGHQVVVLLRPSDNGVVRVINRTTKYYYRIEVFRPGLGRRLWARVWPFIAGTFLTFSCISPFFAIGANLDAFSRTKGWAASSFLLKLVSLGTIVALLLTYYDLLEPVRRAMAGRSPPNAANILFRSPAFVRDTTLSYLLTVAYFQIRSWNTHRMAAALDKLSLKLM